MAIRYAQGEMRAVDSDSGEYLTTEFVHRHHPTRNYTIHAADGSKLVTATAQQKDVDLSGDGRVGIHKVNVLLLEEWSGGTASIVTDEHSDAAQKLARFLEVFFMDHPDKRPTISFEIKFNLGTDRETWRRLDPEFPSGG